MAYTRRTFQNNEILTADQMNEISEGIYYNQTNIGSLTQLKTTNKSDLVHAINEAAKSFEMDIKQTTPGHVVISGLIK